MIGLRSFVLGRPFLVFMHRVFGLVAAGFLLLAGLTGSLLAFQRELDPMLNPRLHLVMEAGPERARDRDLADVARQLEQDYPGAAVGMIAVWREDGRSRAFYLQPKPGLSEEKARQLPNAVFVHPETGAVLGERRDGGLPTRENLFVWVLDLHYTLKLPAEIGVVFLGVLAIFWLVDNVFGTILAFPPGQPARKAFTIKWAGRAYRINCDVHRVLGLALLPIFLMLAVTSIALNLPDQVARPLVGTMSNVSHNSPLPPRSGPLPLQSMLTWTQAIEQAELLGSRIYPDHIHLDSIDRDVARGSYRASFLTPADIDQHTGRSRFHFDAYTGELIRVDRPRGETAGDAFLAWMFPLHGGTAFGVVGRTIIFVAGLAVSALSVTGLVIWWKKRKARVGRKQRYS